MRRACERLPFCVLRRPSALMPKIAQIPPVPAFRGYFLGFLFFVRFRGIFCAVSVLACVRCGFAVGSRAPWGFRRRSCSRRFLRGRPFCRRNRLFFGAFRLGLGIYSGKEKNAVLGRFSWAFGFGRKKGASRKACARVRVIFSIFR